MEFLDLSPYQYLSSPTPMRSLGWLGREHGVQGRARRPMTKVDLRQFWAASSRVVSLTLGSHECDLCANETASRGNGEYHYYLANGDVYAAPMMIRHYILDHGYRLPEAFRNGLDGTTELAWDNRAELLCEVLADDSRDPDLRCQAIADLPHWLDSRAFQALLGATRDKQLVDIVGDEIGRSLVPFLSCDFAAELNAGDLPDIVKYGLGLIL